MSGIYFSRPSAAPRARDRRGSPVTTGRGDAGSRKEDTARVALVQQWFAKHVTLAGKPYTLDLDQARAVCDNHQNTLVTARAGSGKTRVIVAKVAYLVAKCNVKLNEIAVFMFNRTAAAEVNARITEVKVDGESLVSEEGPVVVASTFHKFALDLVKKHGARPEILSEPEHERLLKDSFDRALHSRQLKLPPQDYQETLNIVSGFVARAGQKYPGLSRLPDLHADVAQYVEVHRNDPSLKRPILFHQLSYLTYKNYLAAFVAPKMDFSLLMSQATEILCTAPQARSYIGPYKYLMIDEYQDFSYLFFALTSAIRNLYPAVKIFAVGDDWQAINRFAGSDVDYFINFESYFPEDYTNIPLATNYRSCRRIVEYANAYMLRNYDPKAVRAIPFSKKPGKIYQVNLQKVKYHLDDFFEDQLGDGRFLRALLHALKLEGSVEHKLLKSLAPAAKLLKSLYQIFKKHSRAEIMLLHRHNFTSCSGVTLEILFSALRTLVIEEGIMPELIFTEKVRCLTMHKSKGLESEVVILLEMDAEIVKSHHPHSTIFEIFGDTLAAESADQDRLIYVALTRAKEKLYLLSNGKNPL